MIKHLLLSCCLIAFALVGFSQDKKLVTIKGTAPSYVGQTVSFMTIDDYFSMMESRIASTTVLPDSTFSVSFYANETQKIIVRASKNKSFLYIQPNGVYDIYIPAKDKFEPYRPSGNNVEITFFNLDTNEII